MGCCLGSTAANALHEPCVFQELVQITVPSSSPDCKCWVSSWPHVPALPRGSDAALAGLRKGDTIVAINDKYPIGRSDAQEMVANAVGKPLLLKVRIACTGFEEFSHDGRSAKGQGASQYLVAGSSLSANTLGYMTVSGEHWFPVMVGDESALLTLSTYDAEFRLKLRDRYHVYRIDTAGFLSSLVKPVDKFKNKELIVRGPLRVDDRGQYTFLNMHAVAFRSVESREHFVSLVAGVRQVNTLDNGAEIRISVCSWNVGKYWPDSNLIHWLGVDSTMCDVVVVTSQDCSWSYTKIDPYTQRMVPETSPPPSTMEEAWNQLVLGQLNKRLKGNDSFLVVTSLSHADLRIAVFAKKRVVPSVGDVETGVVPLAHLAPWAGAVGVGLKLLETPLMFIGCHLPRLKASERPAKDATVSEVLEKLSRGVGTPGFDISSEYFHTFIAGDLGFTTDKETFEAKVKVLEESGEVVPSLLTMEEEFEWDLLLECDTLALAPEGSFLPCFHEPSRPAFAPTFPSLPARERFGHIETAYRPTRLPCWPDRILVSSALADAPPVTVLYTSTPEMQSSEHKPVRAILSLTASLQAAQTPRAASACSSPLEARLAERAVSPALMLEPHSNMPKAKVVPIQVAKLCWVPESPDTRSLCIKILSPGLLDCDTVLQTAFSNHYEWDDVLGLAPTTADVKTLGSEVLYFIIKEESSRVGECAVSMATHSVPGEWAKFTQRVYRRGEYIGELRGKIAVLAEAVQPERRTE
eukprot:Sspe_Gene.16201::Locus_5706_Transcript_1_1_Confidence_1.000_Length_2704::g.16201::m.16201